MWTNIIWYIRMYLNTRNEYPTEKRLKSEANELLLHMHKKGELLSINLNEVNMYIVKILELLHSIPKDLTKQEIWCRLRNEFKGF